MEGVWEEPNVEDCTCPERSHHHIGCFSDMAIQLLLEEIVCYSLVLTLMGMLPGDCTDGGVWEEPNVNECTCI